MVVPVFSDKEDWLGKDAVKPLYKLYREVTKGKMNKSASGGENESLNAWKEYLDELSEKGEQLPVPELASDEYQQQVQAIQDTSDKTEKITVLEQQSQEAFHDLEEHEQLFDARFKAHGQTAFWIPRPEIPGKPGSYAPSNDFYWAEKDFQATELKSSKTKYSTISTRIRDSVARARAHEVSTVKENFIIDLGVYPLSTKLRKQLSGYNRKNPNTQIQSLWIMHSAGREFEEINLE